MQLVRYDYKVSFLFVRIFILLSFHAQGQVLPQTISSGTTPAPPVLWFNGEKFHQLIKMALYCITQLLTRRYLAAVHKPR